MSNIPNRKQAPAVATPGNLPHLLRTPLKIDGFMPCYAIEGGAQDVVSIEVVFPAGTRYEEKPLQAASCLHLIKEGTESFSAEEISGVIDFFGAQLSTEVSKDHASISLIVMNKYLGQLLPVFSEICCKPVFHESELMLYAKKSRSALEVNLQKVEFICRLAFSKLLFGNHPYRDDFSPDDYDKLKVTDIAGFFEKNYNIENAFCIISGMETNRAAAMVSSAFAKNKIEKAGTSGAANATGWSYSRGEVFVPKEGALQSAIRMGMAAPARTSEDYPAFYLIHTALGGYFGSRLMQNIREEKGFTYGIGSSINILEHGAYFVITTQVGAQHTLATIAEIEKEIYRLRNEPILVDEFELIQNYVAGTLLQSMDGPFELSGKLKSMIVNNLPEGYYPKFLEAIFAATPVQVQIIARKYFEPKQMSLSVAGCYE